MTAHGDRLWTQLRFLIAGKGGWVVVRTLETTIPRIVVEAGLPTEQWQLMDTDGSLPARYQRTVFGLPQLLLVDEMPWDALVRTTP